MFNQYQFASAKKYNSFYPKKMCDFESLPPTEPQSQLLGVYNFSWAIDLEGSILESNETDNVKPITVSAYGSTSELLHRPGPVSQNTPDWEFETLSPNQLSEPETLDLAGDHEKQQLTRRGT